MSPLQSRFVAVGISWAALLSFAVDITPAQPTEQFGDRKQAEPSRPRRQGPVPQLGPSFGEQVEQAARQRRDNLQTFVDVVILTPRLGATVAAQRWARVLSDLDVQAQFRAPIGGDELGVDETVRGTFRMVKVVGRLTDDGQLQLGEKRYTTDDVRQLKEWLDETKAYGAQGAPLGKPLWGLSQGQFTEIYEALSGAVEQELEGVPLVPALDRLPLPPQYPLRNSVAAGEWLAAHPAGKIENRMQGLSCGTVLALALREAGLGFQPLRTPSGEIELAVTPLSSGQQVWPVGWELPDGVDHGELVPVLHKFTEIGFDNAALQDVLVATGAAIEVPMLIDYYTIRATGIDLAEKVVSYPLKRTTWALMLNSVIRKANLIKEVRIDERGRPFVYITPFVPMPVERAR